MIEVNSSSHHQSKDNKVEPKTNWKQKLTKTFDSNSLTYLPENEPETYSEAMSYSETFYWKEVVNSEIESIKNNHTWKLVNLPLINKPLGYKWILKKKTLLTNINLDLLWKNSHNKKVWIILIHNHLYQE
jgi:hypothetical protein